MLNSVRNAIDPTMSDSELAAKLIECLPADLEGPMFWA